MKRFILLCLAYILITINSIGYAALASLPDWLMYKGKAIDPLCFFELDNHHSVINLTQCGLKKGGERQKTGEYQSLEEKGYTGFYYRQVVGDDGTAIQGYSYYKPHGLVDNIGIIETINNSGGSGVFTSLLFIKREGDTVHVDVIHSGDRCNGGIAWINKKQNGQQTWLEYGVNITPYALLTISNNKLSNKSYESLPSCAICCQGVAVYKKQIGNDQKQVSEATLKYVDLSIDAENMMRMDASKDSDHCFYKLLSVYSRKYHQRLMPKEIQQLAEEFNKC